MPVVIPKSLVAIEECFGEVMVLPGLAGWIAAASGGVVESATDWISGASELAITLLIDSTMMVAAITEWILLVSIRLPLS